MKKIGIGNSVYIKPNDVLIELDRIDIKNTINSSFNIEIVRNGIVIESVEFPIENNSLLVGDYLDKKGIHRAKTGTVDGYVGNQITAIQFLQGLYVSGGDFYVRISNQNAILKIYYRKEKEIDEQIYVLNKDEELIAVFNKNDEEPIFNPRIKETQNSEAIFSFSISINNPKWKEISNPENLYVVDGKVFSTNFEGCFEEFINESNENYITITAYERQKLLSRKYVRAWNSETGFEYIDTFMVVILSGGSLPLKNNGELVESMNPRGTSGYVLDALLFGTGWKTGTCDVEGVFDFESDQVDIYENILKVQQIWGGILVFDSFNKIVHHRDETKWLPYEGFEVKYQKNMQSLEKIYNNKIVTKLCPLGEGGLNIKSVNNDSEWLTDFSYTHSILEGIENNPDITDPEQLKAWGERKLKDLCKPRKELTVQAVLLYQVEGYELERIYLNYIVDVINYNGVDGDIEQLRVVGFDYSPWDYSDAILELSDITLESTDIFKKTVSASNTINNGTLNAKKVVDFFNNGKTISGAITETNKTIDSTKSTLEKTDKEIKGTVEETTKKVNTLNGTVESQKEIIDELKLTVEGLENKLTEKGGNNLLYYDNEFWKGSSKMLPNTYEKVKYIKSTGTQFINTGYFPKTNTTLELDLKFDGVFRKKDTNAGFFGTVDERNNTFSMNFGGSETDTNTVYSWIDKTYASGAATAYPMWIDNLTLFIKNKLTFKSGTFQYGNTLNIATKTENQNSPLYIFGSINNGVEKAFNAYDMVLYEAKIYEAGVLARYFIPCIRKGDGVAGLYDAINKIFYENQGTGSFEYELILPDEYQEVEYLQSTGAEYVNTNHVFTGKTTFDIDVMEIKHGNSEWCMFLGARKADATLHLLMNCNTTGFIGGDYGVTGSAFQGAAGSSDMRNKLAHINTTIENSNYIVSLNGKTYKSTPYQEFTTGLSGALFAFNAGGNFDIRATSFRIYGCKIYEDNVLVRNFIPCYKKENNVTGLYDMVNGKFYQNGGTGTFARGNEVDNVNLTTYILDTIEEYVDTEIRNNSISGRGYIINKGSFEQSVNNIINGMYTVSFKYKKLKELATGSFYINNIKYDLTAMDWEKFEQPIEVNSNNITVKFESDSNKSFYITDLLVNVGEEAEIWTQNPNETRTDTVKIGKGIQVDSTATNTYHRIDSDGNRTYNKQTGEVVSEQTDKGTKTAYLEANNGEMSGLLFQKVIYNDSEQTWISSLL